MHRMQTVQRVSSVLVYTKLKNRFFTIYAETNEITR